MALDKLREGKSLAGWPSGFRAQTGYVACDVIRCLGEAAAPGWGDCGPCPDFVLNTLAFALQLRKITENLSQGSRISLGRTVPSAVRFVDLATASGRLDWSAVPCRPWLSRQATGPALGKFKYLPSFRTRGFPTSANFESKLSVRTLMWSAKS